MTFKPENVIQEVRSIDQEQASYRQIFKATSIFGGVQVFQILIGIVRTKFVAILLGTAGVGIMGLFNAPLQLILSLTGLGITFSAVRDISEAYGNSDQNKLNRTVTTLRRWSWIAGVLGLLVTIALSPLLSRWTFGSNEYTWAFIWLSLTMLLQTISNGQKTVIQGTRRLKDLAKANVYGSLAGLLTAVPLYYFFGLKGIVPSLILTALTGLLLSIYFVRKAQYKSVNMSWKETATAGKSMIKLGLIITVTGIIGFFTGYILNAFISRVGGVDQVGLYNAGWSIIGQSTGLVFAAMTTDYFPRLSAINKDDIQIRSLVNQQAEMVMFILTPILILLIGAMPVLVRILYSSEFLPVVEFANWMLMGILIKGLVWPVGFIFPAKGDLRVFGIVEISAMTFNVLTNVVGYFFFGLTGLGVSFILNYSFGLFITLLFAQRKYGFKYGAIVIKSFILNLILVILVFICTFILKGNIRYAIASLMLVVSAVYSFKELDRRMNLKTIILNLPKIRR